ncbi:MAG: hydroxymethylbilane synthase [Streptomycetaceae bacterium]|nr:hydroxymethylbilane synthase [Streptomycetaceae bacterium]
MTVLNHPTPSAEPAPTTPAIPRVHCDAPAGASRRTLKLGTRRSKLAMAQSGQVAEKVSKVTGRPVELVEITTYGDTSREALDRIGGTGVFVSALRDALLEGRIDFAVHSLKDLPTTGAEGLLIAAIPLREDPRDVLIARDGLTFEQLTGAETVARIGTGSPRRMSQLKAWARALGRHIEVIPIRGNIDTRIGYVASGDLDAVVLAAAGLRRIDRLDEATELLHTEVMLPAPGQGALAVECSAERTELAAELAELDDPFTRAAVTAERSLLAALEAGCSAPVGALAEPDIGRNDEHGSVTELRLRGVVGTTDGTTLVQMSATGPLPASREEATALGRELAEEMLAKGAAGLMGERAL